MAMAGRLAGLMRSDRPCATSDPITPELPTGPKRSEPAICLVLFINGTIGFLTELRAARSMEALRMMGKLTTRVRREGGAMLTPAEDLVPCDIVLSEGGDVVTADLRLVEASNLSADEAARSLLSHPPN